MAGSPLYITTPIYYVNDKPHIGHVYTTILCDVWARFLRFQGQDVFFLTGTDEHGMKIEKAAEARGIDPQQLVDENAAEFKRVMSLFEFTNNDFIRTTEDRHVRQVQELVRRLEATGAVYLGEFEGWYDEGQEEYVPENKAKDLDYKSPVSGRSLVKTKEKNYYFRLSAFQDRMEKLLEENPDFIRPQARRNEILGRLRDGLQDVPMSRTSFSWGIPMPNHDEHVIYVWIEALMNYITGLGMVEPDRDAHELREKYWPATYHIVGKEILWFHTVIWPCILMALDMTLPRCVYAHSFWIREGQKMSKTLGNFIDLEAIYRYSDAYGSDMWRYYMITQGPLGATDSNFSSEHYHDVYHTDLVNTLGNCASRVTAMINKYFDGQLPCEIVDGQRLEMGDLDWPSITSLHLEKATQAMVDFDLPGSVSEGLALIRQVDAFINDTEPFKLAKDESKRDELGAILYQCAEVIRIASLILWAVLPDRIPQLWEALGQDIDPARGDMLELAKWGGLKPGTSITKVALFPRIESPVEA